MALAWQPSLLDAEVPRFDAGFRRAARQNLASGAWVDVLPGWVAGADGLFQTVLATAPWAEHHRPMYDRMVLEPRLTTRAWPDPPPVVRDMAGALGRHYQRHLDVVSANLYRDGRDSVAWHGDRVGHDRDESVVAIVSLGSPRRFLLRPTTGGRSLRLAPAAGDLLVLGGTVQRTWQHSVPKVASAGPRISIMFREQYDE